MSESIRFAAIAALALSGCNVSSSGGDVTQDAAVEDASSTLDAAASDARDADAHDTGAHAADTNVTDSHASDTIASDSHASDSIPFDSIASDVHDAHVDADAADATTTRDPLKWPFAVDSIWNTPIGTGAVYVAAKLSTSAPHAMPQIDDERIILTPTAPSTDVDESTAAWSGADRCAPTGGLIVALPIPTSYVVPSSMQNNSAAILSSDGYTIVQTQPFTRCTAGGVATSWIAPIDVDIFGDGIRGAHGGSGLSAIGGSIRVGELRPGMVGMRHALKVNVYAAQALYECGTRTDCYRWPALNADGYAVGHYGTVGPNLNKSMKMGALLAIPASTDLTKLGLETEPGKQLAWTLQNYGAYVVDDTWGPGFALNAENGPDGSMRTQFKADWSLDFEVSSAGSTAWSRDIQRLMGALYVVDNNGPTSIGGGGTPLQPLAPPFH